MYSVLIVDDEQDIIESVKEFLELHEDEFKVFEAKNGHEALFKIENTKIDLLITDLNMPVINGKELLNNIKGLSKTQRPNFTMVISGNVEKEKLRHGKEGVSVLKKPFDLDRFHYYLNVVLGNIKLKKKNPKKEINIEYINPFIDAAIEVLDVMASLSSEKEFVSLKEDHDAFGDITGIIPVKGNGCKGSFAISFPEELYLHIMTNMLGEECTEINDENRDGVAELCNQVLGNAKVALSDMGYKLDLTSPKVLEGIGHEIKHLVKGPVVNVIFDTEHGSYSVEAIINKV